MTEFYPPGVFRTEDPDGHVRFVMPGEGPTRLHASSDVIEDPTKFMTRQPATCLNESADSLDMVRQNAYKNRRLGRMQDWRDLWGKEIGKICLFISCGPSLTDSLPELWKLLNSDDRDKYFTLGINRAIKAVDLDYYMVADRRCQDDWVDRDVSQTRLIAATTARHAICEKFENRYWGEEFLGGVDESNAPLRTGLSITMADAMHVAYKLGAEELWLYGADFAMSGSPSENGQQYMLEKYYFDMPSYVGLAIRPDKLREMQPVMGIGQRVVFINHELLCYACYATAMALMIEKSGCVPVKNKSKAGIMFYGTEE